MRDLNEELDRLQRAAAAVGDFPGAAAAGFGALKRLRRLYQRQRSRFTPATLKAIDTAKQLLPRPGSVELVRCSACHGMGTQRWMKAYKHVCNACGGWLLVPRTPEVVREIERTWGQARRGTVRPQSSRRR